MGGGQERNIRPGTENVAGALALAACLEKHALPENLRVEYALARLRWKKLLASLKNIDRCCLIPAWREPDDDGFSPYIVQAAFRNIPGEVMARALDDLGFAVSTGSACTSAVPERRVLAAMGVEENVRLEGIRISQGWLTTDEEIDLLLEAITEVLKFL
jgi:cysteine desulfurase